MRFLCLHGRGTNSEVLEMQTAALRYELGETHTYEFVEGIVPAEFDPDLKSLVTENDTGYSYFDEQSPASGLAALLDLDSYIEWEGPFDGIIAFSSSVGLVGTWLISRQRRGLPSVRCCVFLSGVSVMDPDKLQDGAFVRLTADQAGEIIDIPTAHIYGVADPHAPEAEELSALCRTDVKSVYVHPGQHEVPGSGSTASTKEVVNRTVNVIRRAISLSNQ